MKDSANNNINSSEPRHKKVNIMKTQTIQFTEFTADVPDNISKEFQLSEDAKLMQKSSGNLTKGKAKNITVDNIKQFADYLVTLTPDHALAYGISQYDQANVRTQNIVNKLGKAANDGKYPTIARDRHHFQWSTSAGILMLDYDPKTRLSSFL